MILRHGRWWDCEAAYESALDEERDAAPLSSRGRCPTCDDTAHHSYSRADGWTCPRAVPARAERAA